MSGDAGSALITGAGGQVGLALRQCPPAEWEIQAYDAGELDVSQADQVRAVMRRVQPTLVIHAAAFTGVDAAESNAAQAEAVNVTGTRYLAESAREVGARVVYLSTDFVFDGSAGRPYAPEDPPHPLGVYGRTKLGGERAVLQVLGEDAVVLRETQVVLPVEHLKRPEAEEDGRDRGDNQCADERDPQVEAFGQPRRYVLGSI